MKEFIIKADSPIDNAEELIRCKDCIYYRVKTYRTIVSAYEGGVITESFCEYFSTFCNRFEVDDDDYCSAGRKKGI